MSLLKAVQAVQVFQDKRWIPEDFEDWSYFSERDIWHYISISDERRCWNCEQFDGMDFFGDELRTMFPDLVIVSEHIMEARVHVTLWGKETCRCKLVRVAQPKAPRILKELIRGTEA